MNDTLKRGIDGILARSPAQPLFHWRASDRVAVLAYHAIDDPDRFEKQLDLLQRSYHPISAEEFARCLGDGDGLPRHAVLITFDDGHRSVYETAMPMLRERGMPGVVFVIAGLLDGFEAPWFSVARQLASSGGSVAGLPNEPDALVRALKRIPDDVRRSALEELERTAAEPPLREMQLRTEELPILESAGIEIGNHTMTHPCLPRCDQQRIVDEVSQAQGRLTGILGHAPSMFAYPNGDHDSRSATAIREAGCESAFLFDHRLIDPRRADRLALSRLRTNSAADLDRFRTIVSGLHPAVHHARGGI